MLTIWSSRREAIASPSRGPAHAFLDRIAGALCGRPRPQGDERAGVRVPTFVADTGYFRAPPEHVFVGMYVPEGPCGAAMRALCHAGAALELPVGVDVDGEDEALAGELV